MTPAAQCAVHPQASAARTCGRCGNFMCDECSLGGAELHCPKCRALTGAGAFPFSRTNHDFGRIWDYAWAAFQREWVMMSVAVLVLGGAMFGVGIVVQVYQGIATAIAGKGTGAVIGVLMSSQLLSWVLNSIVIGVLWMGINRMTIDVLKGGKADIARIFSQLPKLGTFVTQWLISLLIFDIPIFIYFGGLVAIGVKTSGRSLPPITGNPQAIVSEWVPLFLDISGVLVIGYLIALVPLLYVSLARALVAPEIVYGNAGAWEAIVRAFKLASGFRTSLLGYALIGGLIMLLGVLACCIGVLPAVALWQLLTLSLYLALRNGSGLPPPAE